MNNIILIGMPGAGKSTIGVLLAKHTSKAFIDTDLLIQHRHKTSLQDIVDQYGYLILRQYEEDAILSIRAKNTVIATGGSAVYSKGAMHHLKLTGSIIYLKLDKRTLLKRLRNYETRGIARPPEQSFDSLFLERTMLYEQYADITVNCRFKRHDDIVSEIMKLAVL